MPKEFAKGQLYAYSSGNALPPDTDLNVDVDIVQLGKTKTGTLVRNSYLPPIRHKKDDKHHMPAIQDSSQALDVFPITAEDLGHVCNFDERNHPELLDKLESEYQGVYGIAHRLKTDPEQGLSLIEQASNGTDPQKTYPMKLQVQDVAQRQKAFGTNVIPPPPSESILQLIVGQVKEDVILQVLIVGAILVGALGTALCPTEGYIEGLAILIAVIIVLAVTSGNDWSKDRKFKKLLLLQSDKKVKVIRGGIKDQISSWDLLVGDLVELVPGDEVPADGLFFKGTRLVVDESPLTGESLPVKKSESFPFLFSGCQVSEGSAWMLVTAVGPRSSAGQIQKLLNESVSQATALQEKLRIVAIFIGKVGVAAGVMTFLGLAIRWAILWQVILIPFMSRATNQPSTAAHGCNSSNTNPTLVRLEELAQHFVIGITVVVVAVPEGLPLAVTISLAFSMFKMIQDKCFVRHLDASETMGEATCICTDKTGTLTENRMTVVKMMIGKTEYVGEGSGDTQATSFHPLLLPTHLRDILTEGMCINSTCFIKTKEASALPVFVGSATEGALLILSEKLGIDYQQVRRQVVQVENAVWPFTSDRKRMSTLVQDPCPSVDEMKRYRLYTKGASEIVFGLCKYMLTQAGSQVVLISETDRTEIQDKIKRYASQGLRTIALAYKNMDEKMRVSEDSDKPGVDPEKELVFIGLVGIKDPVRKQVPNAVAQCQRAGLDIKMVTGDNILTACKIAKECGILKTGGVAMEGPTFRNLSESDKRKIAPKLQVLARSSPSDKFILVSLLKTMGHVVAVTGDGTNDAPALKEADVGFAMGISGTQIAMNASDIILLDDNFVSLVQSIKWGRNVLDSVRKFLQFQLAVNFIAITITFIGSVVQGEAPLNTVQLLWVNLIMDTFGALALASDEPGDHILDHPPHSRKANLLSFHMKFYMLFQILYQVPVLLGILFGLDRFVPDDPSILEQKYHSFSRVKTVVFCSFVFLQVTNLIMSRQLSNEINVFQNMLKNKLFGLMILLIIAVQLLVVMLGGSFISTTTMTTREWAVVVVAAIGNIPFTFLCRLFLQLLDRKPSAAEKKTLEKSGLTSEYIVSSEMDMGV